MSEEKPSEQTDASEAGIPAPLLDDLHNANEQFHRAREHVEKANEALVNPFEERERASQELLDAERAMEEVEEKIGKEFGKK